MHRAAAKSRARITSICLVTLTGFMLSTFVGDHAWGARKKSAKKPTRGAKAWTRLLNRGSQSDLPKFLALLDGDTDDSRRIVAYRATHKWGNQKQQRRVYLSALRSKREVLAIAAMNIFVNRTPAIRQALCDWVQRGRWQTTRLNAAKRLVPFQTRHVVGCLILALREKFQPVPPDRHPLKYVAGVLTLGIAFWAMHRQRKKRHANFDLLISNLSARLRQMSGVDFGNDYHTWLDWALHQGYTVGDMTLVQLLFSPYSTVRRRAQATAVDLLDDRGTELARRHASLKDGGARLRVALAQALMDAGLLAPGRIPLPSQPAPVAPHSKRPPGTGCGGCADCRNCDTGHSGGGPIPLTWILVALWLWFRRRRRTRRRALFMTLTATLLLAHASPAQARGTKPSPEARLAAKIRAARFHSERSPLALKLGRLGTPTARQELLKLMKEIQPIYRGPIVQGLLLLKDATLTSFFLHQLRTAMFVRGDIEPGLVKDMALYYPGVEKALGAARKKEQWSWHGKLLGLIAQSRHPRGRPLLEGLVKDKVYPGRDQALQLLAKHWASESNSFIRGLVTDPDVARTALEHLLRTATVADLPLFRSWADLPGTKPRVAAGFNGVQRFGAPSLRERIFLRELRGKSEPRAQLAMLSFSVKNPSVRQALCRWSRTGSRQNVRLTAALQLLGYTSRPVIPCLIPLLREGYAGEEGSSILHGVFAFLTVGISAVAMDSSKANSIKGFYGAQRAVAKHLTKLTGVNHGRSYWRWRDWAAEQGYSVGGRNLLQVLLSTDPARQKRAQVRALALLGFSDAAQFIARHPLKGRSLSLALVAELQAKGHLKDEPKPQHMALVRNQILVELQAEIMKMEDKRSLLGKLLGCNCRSSTGGGSAIFFALILIWLWRRRSGQVRRR